MFQITKPIFPLQSCKEKIEIKPKND